MEKVLIIHTAFIGDIVLSTPIIEKIKKTNNNIEVYYLTTPAGKAVLQNNPNIKEIIVYDKRGIHKGIKGFLEIIKIIKSLKIDRAFILHRYLRSSLIAFLGNIRERVGYNIAAGSFLYTKKVEYKKEKHEVERILSFLDDNKSDENKIVLYPSESDVEKVEKMWKSLELYGKNVIAIAPGSKWFTKMWPIEYFNKVLEKLALNNNIKILVVGGKEEEGLNIEKYDNVENLIGKSSLLELKAIFDKCNMVVTNDSSPIHIASSTKAFIVAIFGATVKEFGFYPWSKNSIVVEVEGLECRPCGIHGGKTCPKNHFRCMREITPEMVYDIIIKNMNMRGE